MLLLVVNIIVQTFKNTLIFKIHSCHLNISVGDDYNYYDFNSNDCHCNGNGSYSVVRGVNVLSSYF